ncbi:hypothetical protein [Hyalangium gracile]|uniref:hypothetical protein n=1 Tax=Hyalangium gracile TaxID=394092 RepID=UPI001CCD56E1|nr:hypothetical protein [Hyalangium gracile]
MKSTLKASLERLSGLDGYIRSCVVDGESATLLARHGASPPGDPQAATAAQITLLQAQRRALQAFQQDSSKLAGELDETLITVGRYYYLIRPSRARASVFVSVVLDRERANLGRARLALSTVEQGLSL